MEKGEKKKKRPMMQHQFGEYRLSIVSLTCFAARSYFGGFILPNFSIALQPKEEQSDKEDGKEKGKAARQGRQIIRTGI